MRYLSPQSYRRQNEGLINPPSNTTPTDAQIARLIGRAESAIDSYVGFGLLTPSGFAPGTVGVQQFAFDFASRKFRFPLPPVPIRQIDRIRIQISNVSTSGQGLFANLAPGEVAINEYERYCEVVALTLTYSLAGVVWELALNPPIGQIDCECGYYLIARGDTLYNDSGDLLTYNSQRQFWASTYVMAPSIQPNTLPPIPPVIYVNGAVAGGYTINYQEGQVVFSSPQSATATVTADYTYTVPDIVQEACIEQVTYLLIQQSLNRRGMGGLESLSEGAIHLRRSRNEDVEEDQLCAKARTKLTPHRGIALA